MNAEGVDDSLEMPESFAADAEEVDEVSDMSEADETIGNTASATKDYDYDAAEVEQGIVAEDEKLSERQRREFAVQHGLDQEVQGSAPLIPFYEGVEAPALGADQLFLDMKLNFKTDLTYFVGVPVPETSCILTIDAAVPPDHTTDRVSRTGSRSGHGQDASIHLPPSIASYKA